LVARRQGKRADLAAIQASPRRTAAAGRAAMPDDRLPAAVRPSITSVPAPFGKSTWIARGRIIHRPAKS